MEITEEGAEEQQQQLHEETTNVEEAKEEAHDPRTSYADTSSHKVTLYGLDKYFQKKHLDKLLKEWQIPFEKTKKIAGTTFATIVFRDAKTRDEYLPILKEHEIRGAKIQIKEGGATKKRPRDGTNGGAAKRQKCEPTCINDVVTSLWKTPYEEQLKLKVESVKKAFENIVSRMKKTYRNDMPAWLKENMTPQFKDMPFCPITEIIPSPELNGYRNKVSFSIGKGQDGAPCIGFAMGRVENDVFSIGDPSECLNVSDHAKKIRNAFQEFISASPLPVYDKSTHTGCWRQLTVKTQTTGEAMAALQYAAQGMDKEVLAKEEQRLIEFIQQKKELGIESLITQEWNGLSNAAPLDCPYKVLSGEKYIHEKLFDLQFQISYNSFFQVNTKGAEKLYAHIAEWCPKDPNNLILDLCCGTGTIGLSLTRHTKVNKILGVEMCEEAVEDARHNAKVNNIENVEFIASKAEDVMNYTLQKIGKQKCFAVVDPPRAGLHKDTVRAIRGCATINQLVYVSCDRNGLLENAIDLCRPTSLNYTGNPFRPVKAACVDLFPHTELVEVVVLFERIGDTPPTPSKEQTTSAEK